MNNAEIKQRIEDHGVDEETLNRIVILEGDEFADGAIGITEDNRVAYSYSKLVESLARVYGTEEDAIEWLEYNTLRSIPYVESQGLLAPVIVYDIF